MRFSIIIPMYNKEQTIRRALYSAIDQVTINRHDVEIIVVDDGSTDGSAKQVRAVIDEQNDRTIRLLQKENGGVSSARNLGAEFARFEYLAFLDADDTYAPSFLMAIKNLITSKPKCRFFATSYNFISIRKGSSKRANLVDVQSSVNNFELEDFFASAANGDLPFCSSSICIHSSLFREIKGFPENENMGEDQALFSQVALHHSIAYTPNAHSNYYLDVEGSLMKTQSVPSELPFSMRLQKQLDEHKIPVELRASIKRYIAGHLLDLVRRNLQSNNIHAARSILSDKRIKAKFSNYCYWKLLSTPTAHRITNSLRAIHR